MLDVFFTVDVEVWCGGWDDLDTKFPDAFRRYVYGPTRRGDYGLPYQLRTLGDHGLDGVFFVEPLFAARFGPDPLAEIVGLLNDAGQEVQLHLHTEWVDEAREPLLPNATRKRQFLFDHSLPEQKKLIAAGLKLLDRAGAGDVNAFRAGSFGFNTDTLAALSANGVTFDSSYNASMHGPSSGLMPGVVLYEPIESRGVHEYPMTVFRDGTRSLRHAQLGACSYREIEGLLWRALESGRKAFVILSHNFELMNQALDAPDNTVVARFDRLCAFFDRHRDCFRLRGFRDLEASLAPSQPMPLDSPLWKTGLRMVEQLSRRRYS